MSEGTRKRELDLSRARGRRGEREEERQVEKFVRSGSYFCCFLFDVTERKRRRYIYFVTEFASVSVG